ELLQRHFPIGESGPLVVVAQRPNSQWLDTNNREQIGELAAGLLSVDGVTAVRNVTNPLGDPPPKARLSVREMARRAAMAKHRRSTEMFVSSAPGMAGDVTKLELILGTDPFDIEAIQILERVNDKLAAIKQDDPYWS